MALGRERLWIFKEQKHLMRYTVMLIQQWQQKTKIIIYIVYTLTVKSLE